MTAEQLEELLTDAYGDDQKKWEAAWYKLRLNCDHLARRVLAAEKLVEALEKICSASGQDAICPLITTYREASK